MTQFGGSLRFVQLPAVVQLLSELASTGRLCVSYAEWTGEIIVREGQIVDAQLGNERGRAALEAIAVALPDGEFSFADEPVEDTGDALVSADERAAYLDRLSAEHRRLSRLIPSLKLVPRLVETPNGDLADAQVTIGAATLQLIPALALGHTLDQVARQRGLARTMREVAVLMQGGVVELVQPAVPPLPLGEGPTSAEKPARAPAPPPAPMQPAPVAPFSARLTARRFAPRQRPDVVPVSTAVAASAVQPVANVASRPIALLPRPAMPTAIAERLAAARPVLVQPAPLSLVPPAWPRQTAPLARWRKALVGFFVYDEQAVSR